MLRKQEHHKNRQIGSGIQLAGAGILGTSQYAMHHKYGSGKMPSKEPIPMRGEGSLLELVKTYRTSKNMFPGERHLPQFNAQHKAVLGNYIGPDTDIVKRLTSSDAKVHNPVSPTDAVAMKHDVEYAIAEYEPNRASQRKKVRDADNEMIAKLKKIQAKKGDNALNIQIGLRGIQGKQALEKIGIFSKDKYSGAVGKLGDEDLKVLEDAKEKLDNQGGVGMALKAQLLKKLEKEDKKKQRGKGLLLAGQAEGSGLLLAGQTSLGNAKTMVQHRKDMEGGNVLDWLKNNIAKPLAKGWGTFVSALKPIGGPVAKAVGLGDEYDMVQGLAEKAKSWGGSGISAEHLMNQILHHRRAFEAAIDFLEKQKTVLNSLDENHPHHSALKESIAKQQKFVKKFVSVVRRLRPIIGSGKKGMAGSGYSIKTLSEQMGEGVLSAVWNLAKGLISKIAPSVIKAGTTALVSKGADVISQKTGVDLSRAVAPVSDAIAGKVGSVVSSKLG